MSYENDWSKMSDERECLTYPNFKTGMSTLDRFLSREGGFARGSSVLLGGCPGVGKTTLLLQIAAGVKVPVLFVSGEQAQRQLIRETERLAIHSPNSRIMGMEYTLNDVKSAVRRYKPQILIIDSVQSFELKLADIRSFVKWVRDNQTVVIFVNHLNKQGEFSGSTKTQQAIDSLFCLDPTGASVQRTTLSKLKHPYGGTKTVSFNGLRFALTDGRSK